MLLLVLVRMNEADCFFVFFNAWGGFHSASTSTSKNEYSKFGFLNAGVLFTELLSKRTLLNHFLLSRIEQQVLKLVLVRMKTADCFFILLGGPNFIQLLKQKMYRSRIFC